MNSRQLQYAIQLAELCSFSQAAEKLSVTQPALSKQIKALEEELGLKLFNRDTVPLTLTPGGEYFIRKAKDLLYSEKQLLASIEQFKSGEAGRLTVGISPSKSIYLIPDVLKKVKERYPNIQIVLEEARSDILRKDAAEGKYDLAILNHPIDDTLFDIYPIKRDELILAVPNAMLDKLSFEEKDGTVDFKSCSHLPFITVGEGQELRTIFDRLCTGAGFYPIIAAEIKGGIVTARALMLEGIGATVLPLQFAEKECEGKAVTLFKLKEKITTRQPAVVIKKGQYVSEYAKYAVEILTR